MTNIPPRPPGHCESDDAWNEFCQRYESKPRADLAGGHMSDFYLANAVYMADRNSLGLIGLQTAAKERIRWLSIELAKAQAEIAALTGGAS